MGEDQGPRRRRRPSRHKRQGARAHVQDDLLSRGCQRAPSAYRRKAGKPVRKTAVAVAGATRRYGGGWHASTGRASTGSPAAGKGVGGGSGPRYSMPQLESSCMQARERQASSPMSGRTAASTLTLRKSTRRPLPTLRSWPACTRWASYPRRPARSPQSGNRERRPSSAGDVPEDTKVRPARACSPCSRTRAPVVIQERAQDARLQVDRGERLVLFGAVERLLPPREGRPEGGCSTSAKILEGGHSFYKKTPAPDECTLTPRRGQKGQKGRDPTEKTGRARVPPCTLRPAGKFLANLPCMLQPQRRTQKVAASAAVTGRRAPAVFPSMHGSGRACAFRHALRRFKYPH